MEHINKHQGFLSEEERKWLSELDEPREVRKKLNHLEEYTDYDERYDDYFREEIKKKDKEDRERWLSVFKEERETLSDEAWRERRNGIVIMVNEGIIEPYVKDIFDYVERNTPKSSV